MLGDIHYDQWKYHDMDWVNANRPTSMHRQIQGYVDSTDQQLPRLLTRIRHVIANAPSPVAAVLHIGDFVQGLCGSYDLQAQQSNDAIRLVEAGPLGVPFIMVKGNHDVTGPGSEQAFDDVLLPWIGKNLGQDLASANFTWRRENDLFACFDAYRPDMTWLHSLSKEAADARHVFFLIHPPVVPYNARADWHVFSGPDALEDRRALMDWLGRHHAIVLSGHLHRYALLSRRTETGPFVQFAINSVVRKDQEVAEKTRTGLRDYSPALLELEPDFSPDTRAERRRWLESEAPFINSYDYARAAGFAVLWVYEDQVEADVYLGHSEDVWRQVILSGQTPGVVHREITVE
jgi:hypothetical protein